MRTTLKKLTYFIGLTVCLAGCGVSGTVSNEVDTEEQLSVSLNDEWQETQSEKEKKYQNLLKSGEYTEDNIYVQLDRSKDAQNKKSDCVGLSLTVAKQANQ